MKRLLLGTSAIALAGAFAAPANAADWNVRVGGFINSYFGYAHSTVSGLTDPHLNGVDEKEHGRVYFLPSITLDNGIQFGADMRFNVEGAGTTDQSFAYAKGSFGQIELGQEKSAGYKMTYAAPQASSVAGSTSGSLTAFFPYSGTANQRWTGAVNQASNPTAVVTGNSYFRGTLGSTFIEELGNTSNNANRISYFTPRIAGVQLGFSYARDPVKGSNQQFDVHNGITNFTDIGANYVKSFGGVDVALSGRYGFATANSGAKAHYGLDGMPEIYSGGINLGYMGFTIGGSYAEQNGGGNTDGQSYDAGIEYDTGPWAFSFSYFHGRNVDDQNFQVVNGVGYAFGGSETVKNYVLAADYKLAKGVKVGLFGVYGKFNAPYQNGAAPGYNNAAAGAYANGGSGSLNVNSWVVGTELDLNF